MGKCDFCGSLYHIGPYLVREWGTTREVTPKPHMCERLRQYLNAPPLRVM